LDLLYEGANVLLHEQDYYDVAFSYLTKAAQDNIRHIELSCNPQTHTGRGIPFSVMIGGILRAVQDAKTKFGISCFLIFAILRHLDEDAALRALEEALAYRTPEGKLAFQVIGLDSSEIGHPPSKFERVFQKAREANLQVVAHAGEEGPPSYVWEALEKLKIQRVDHGVRCLEDPKLVELLQKHKIPLTVCPLSNVRLKVFDKMTDHVLPSLLSAGLRVTINSDDPAYFGGYLTDNFLAIQAAFHLTKDQLARFSLFAIQGCFLDEQSKQVLITELQNYFKKFGFELTIE